MKQVTVEIVIKAATPKSIRKLRKKTNSNINKKIGPLLSVTSTYENKNVRKNIMKPDRDTMRDPFKNALREQKMFLMFLKSAKLDRYFSLLNYHSYCISKCARSKVSELKQIGMSIRDSVRLIQMAHSYIEDYRTYSRNMKIIAKMTKNMVVTNKLSKKNFKTKKI